jgi:hypothetical protein
MLNLAVPLVSVMLMAIANVYQLHYSKICVIFSLACYTKDGGQKLKGRKVSKRGQIFSISVVTPATHGYKKGLFAIIVTLYCKKP